MKLHVTFLALILALQSALAPEAPARSSDGSDKLGITQFVISPLRPSPGEVVKLSLTVKNTGSVLLARVKWSISRNSSVLAFNTRRDLAPGESFDVAVNWIAGPPGSSHQFTAVVSTDNGVIEDPRARQNNTASKTIVVRSSGQDGADKLDLTRFHGPVGKDRVTARLSAWWARQAG